MWEMITEMSTNRLWIWTGIGGSIFGALFIAYMRDTRIALWTFGKWDTLLDYVRDKFGWTWFNQDPDAWMKVNPNIANAIIDLQDRIHTLEKKDGSTQTRRLR